MISLTISLRLVLLLSNSLLFNCAEQYLNAPYKWAANGPFYYDCGGLVCQSIRDYYRLTNQLHLAKSFSDKSSQGLHDWMLKEGYQCEPPSEGCILFYGSDIESITHVAIHGPKNIIIEAGGAGRETRVMIGEQLIEYCSGKDARVRYRNIGHRNDLVASIRFDVK